MKLKNSIIIFVIILAFGALAFVLSTGGFVGKFTDAPRNEEIEQDCFDLYDNDGDSLIDRADPDCDELSCDATGGCLCINYQKCEVRTWDGKDNDGDWAVDEDDPNCIIS